MHWTNIGLILVAGLDFGMALLIWLRNPRHKINISFAITIFFLAVWTFGAGMFRESQTVEAAIFWARALNIGGIILIIPFLLFTIYFPYQTFRLSNLTKGIITLAVIGILVVLFAPDFWFIRNTLVISPPNNNYQVTWGYYLFNIYFLFYIGWAYLNLLRKFLVSTGFVRIQLRFILIGTGVISFFGTVLSSISPIFFNLKYFWIGPYFALPMIVILIYFIFHYPVK